MSTLIKDLRLQEEHTLRLKNQLGLNPNFNLGKIINLTELEWRYFDKGIQTPSEYYDISTYEDISNAEIKVVTNGEYTLFFDRRKELDNIEFYMKWLK